MTIPRWLFLPPVFLLAATVALGQVCTPNANTGVTVDPDLSHGWGKIHGQKLRAQTFTVTGSGCFLLEKVTFSVRKQGAPADLVVEIRNVSGGMPGSTVLASATVTARGARHSTARPS